MDKINDAHDLVSAVKELVHQSEEKGKRAAELVIANEELIYQNEEKGKRAAELVIANEELVYQNEEKGKRAAELLIANEELIFQNEEKGKRASELVIANEELVFQNEEKGKRAAELVIANEELIFQNEEKGKRASELVIANEELVFQNEEKGKRASELVIANEELVFQNEEKEKRAAELAIAYEELTLQSREKGKLASQLMLANRALVFQNEEKEKRAAELLIANEELAFQNEEKGRRAIELTNANKELIAFTYISSHDLKEPLRKIQSFTSLIFEKEYKTLSDNGKYYFERIQASAIRMQLLIEDLLTYSRINVTERKFERADLQLIIDEVKSDLKEIIEDKHVTIEATLLCPMNIIHFQFRQLLFNLISNSIKFSRPGVPPHIIISSEIVRGDTLHNDQLQTDRDYCHMTVEDNGIGFDPQFSERIFEVFQRLHSKEEFEGTGIGLAIVKKIVDNHNGIITATGELGKGATFDIYIPEE